MSFRSWVGAADLPVYKRDRSSAPNVLCNRRSPFARSGTDSTRIPFQGIASRSLRQKFGPIRRVGKHYRRIDVRPVIEDHGRVVDYVLKTILNGRLEYDEAVLVLPRARTVPRQETSPNFERRHLRFQSRSSTPGRDVRVLACPIRPRCPAYVRLRQSSASECWRHLLEPNGPSP
jgi:hypothetical protein